MNWSGHRKKQASDEHSLAGERIGINCARHREEASERGALTRLRAHQDGLVRTWKGKEQARGNHKLESASRKTGQDMKRKQASGTHKLESASGWTG